MHTEIYYARILDRYEYFIPEKIGAYVITHIVNNIYTEKYVGSTINLHNRMSGHCDKNILYIDIYVTDDELIAQRLERILIKLINPSTNRLIYPLSDEDIILMNDLIKENILKEHTNNIIKIGCRYLKYIDYDKKLLIENIEKQKIITEKTLGLRIGKRKLTDIKTSRTMSFDREYLDEIGFTAGTYTVIYEPNRVSIVKEVKDVIVRNSNENSS